jgi:CRP/FNR family transcriptional regulator, cyclic AMP receptor protein
VALMQIRKSHQMELLRNVDLFAYCSAKELRQIGSLTTEHDVKAETVLMKSGDVGMEFFVIVEGLATASRKGVEIARLGPGSFFGELALLDGGPRTATVVAQSDMKLLVLSRREFSSLLMSVPSVARKIIAELGSRLRLTDEMLDDSSALGKRLRTWSL